MKYIIGFLISIGLLIFVFVLIFRGGGDSSKSPNAVVQLVSYADTSTEVQLTIDYPVSADQTHTQTVATVGRDEATYSVLQGYEGHVVRSKSYVNNTTAYANFLSALQISGYSTGNQTSKNRDDRGYCAQGSRYIMEIKDGERTIQRYWSTSCGNIGSFKGKTPLILDLFSKQIPDFGELNAEI